MGLNDTTYAGLIAAGFNPGQLNDVEKKFWIMLATGTLNLPSLQVTTQKAVGASTSASSTLTPTSPSIQLVSASGGAVTITLPTAASANGVVFYVKKTDASANAVTIKAAGSELIDGTNTKVLSTQYTSVQFYSNGTAWFILANN